MSCRKQFHSPECVRYPNGVVVHNDPDCTGGSTSVCPITGRVFK